MTERFEPASPAGQAVRGAGEARAAAFSHLLYEVGDGVARITLNRPDKLNALGIGAGSNRDEIASALALADADGAVGSVLLCAAGRAFCAGGDLAGSGNRGDETVLDNHLFNERILAFFAAFNGMHKPVIAAVHGLCLGAGLGMLAQCDLVIAADDARFGLVEGRIGHPGASELVPLIGAQWTKFLIYTGELIDARRAAEIGLVLVVEPAATLQARSFELARRIAAMPREGTLLNKACIDAVAAAGGRAVGRMVGRPIDAMTKTMAQWACAPDGRRFADVLRSEGMDGLKAARDLQYRDAWLPASKP
jgi:enoyl-CoA hydratase/carnithine racemase